MVVLLVCRACQWISTLLAETPNDHKWQARSSDPNKRKQLFSIELSARYTCLSGRCFVSCVSSQSSIQVPSVPCEQLAVAGFGRDCCRRCFTNRRRFLFARKRWEGGQDIRGRRPLLPFDLSCDRFYRGRDWADLERRCNTC